MAAPMPAEISGPAEESVVAAALRRVIERQTAHSFIASDGVSERLFYFAIGGIRVIRSGPRKTASIGDALVETGKLTAKDMGRVAAAAARESRPFAEECVALGLVAPADVEEASRLKVQEDLLDVFLWDEAEIRLEEGQPPKAFYEGRFEAARVGCHVPTFLQAVLARVDEWKAALGRLPTGRDVYEASPTPPGTHAEEWKNRLVSLLDGSRTVSEAITKCGARRVLACEFLIERTAAGDVKRVAGVAAQRISRDQLVREIEALEEALKVTADAAIVRRRLARALAAAGEAARAASQWRFLGDERRRVNDLDGAIECYRAGVEASPTDFATRELILEIHRHKRDYVKLVADGRPLADVFVKHNLLNRAKNLLLQLVRVAADDAQLRRQLVMVLIGLGERDLALKHLRDLARILEKQNASASELRDVYLRILALDKKDAVARGRLDEITGAKRHRRIIRSAVAAAAVALAALGSWFFYESSVRRDVNAAVAAAREKIEAGDVEGAKAALMLDAHVRAAAAAKTMLERIEAYEKAERDRLAAGGDAADAAARREAEAAEQLAQRAKELSAAGRSTDAYRAYRELFDLYGSSSAAANASIPLKLTVLPADARILLAGEEIGRGSVVLKYSPHAKCTLVVEREGYAPWKRILDGPQEASLDVSLEKPTKWTYAADASIESAALVSGGVVYVAGRDRRLTALSASDGAPQWRTALGFYADASVAPVMTAQGVFVATADGAATCANASTGEVAWRKDVGAGVDRQPVAVGADAVVVPGQDGSLTAFDASGAALWTTGVGVAASAPAAVDAGTFAYVDAKGALAIADAKTGAAQPDPTQQAALHGAPAVRDGRAWTMAEDRTLRVVATASRRALKSLALPAASEFAPTLVEERAYVACVDGGVCAFRASGEPLFRSKIDEQPSASPAFSKGRLYVPGAKGHLFVLDADKGDLLWRFDAKSRITATPTIVDGTLYVPTASGKLFAVEE